jgi:hypothetical protein
MGAGGQAPGPPRRDECRARFRVGKDTGGGRVAVPQLRCDIGAVLDDDQLDQRRGVDVQPQRRCSATSSDTEPRAATSARRRERGRSGKRTSPRRTSSANPSSRPIADSRATRLPRRVTTISTPCSTRSRCSLKRSCRARTPTSSSPRCSVMHRILAATSQAARCPHRNWGPGAWSRLPATDSMRLAQSPAVAWACVATSRTRVSMAVPVGEAVSKERSVWRSGRMPRPRPGAVSEAPSRGRLISYP